MITTCGKEYRYVDVLPLPCYDCMIDNGTPLERKRTRKYKEQAGKRIKETMKREKEERKERVRGVK